MFGAFLTIFGLVALVGLPLFIWKVVRDQANAVVTVTFAGAELRGLKRDSTVKWTHDVGHAIADVQTYVLSSDVYRTSSRSMVAKPGGGWRAAFSFARARDEVLAVVTLSGSPAGGRLMAFAQDGAVRWEMPYADLFGSPGAHFGLDWALRDADFYLVGADRRTALVFQHASKWPWLVVTLADEAGGGRVMGRFLNAGKIDKVRPFATDTHAFLVIMGTSASRDAGMVALVDALAGGGASPEEAGSSYACADCAEGTVFRYLVFPRTEVNVASHAEANRVEGAGQGYADTGGRTGSPVQEFEVTTDETRNPKPRIDDDDIGSSAYASYRFDYGFEKLLGAKVDDTYWKVHRYLERAGRLNHPQASCPERNGPPLVRMWDATRGWRDLKAGGG